MTWREVGAHYQGSFMGFGLVALHLTDFDVTKGVFITYHQDAVIHCLAGTAVIRQRIIN
ncbi:hypothetical protein [Desulforamulus aeronauticus]|uniref:hypothetical protein n=1 Tax=Desulforamulus aeronauticus TaxID=53343 RepID=UPI0015873FEA|nr:hypothetical protein [Desulforamulus aeronauticus]